MPKSGQWCGKCLHPKSGHNDITGECLLTQDGQVPVDVRGRDFELCACDKYEEAVTEPISASDVNRGLSAKPIIVRDPAWLGNKKATTVPPTLQELDEAHAALTGRPTLANSHGWRNEDYGAFEAAAKEEFSDEPLKRIDPALRAIDKRIGSESVATGSESPSARRWRDFQNRFVELAREEQGRAQVITNKTVQYLKQVLQAHCNYREHPQGWERGKPEQGEICLLYTPPHGVWNYSDGISENFLERVRLCVAQAGRVLADFPIGADPEDFWLHRLFLDMRNSNSELLWCASEQGGMILSVCVASATLCAKLERDAVSQLAAPAPASTPPDPRIVGTTETPPSGAELSPLERLPLYESATWYALKFGVAGHAVKELRQIVLTRKTLDTPELANREHELIQFLWREHQAVAAELRLQSVNDIRAQAPEDANREPKSGDPTSDGFRHSDDYRTIEFDGEHYMLTPNQALVVEALYDAQKQRFHGCSSAALLEKIGSPTSRLRDQFQGRDGRKLWEKLIIKVPGRQDMYRLNLALPRKPIRAPEAGSS